MKRVFILVLYNQKLVVRSKAGSGKRQKGSQQKKKEKETNVSRQTSPEKVAA